MKMLQINTTSANCNCPNQHLLTPNAQCEHCMAEVDAMLVWPEGFGKTDFDEAYFEELEAFLTSEAAKKYGNAA